MKEKNKTLFVIRNPKLATRNSQPVAFTMEPPNKDYHETL